MGYRVERRVADLKLPRPVERGGGLAEPDLGGALPSIAGLRRRLLSGHRFGPGPTCTAEPEKSDQCEVEPSCNGNTLIARESSMRTIPAAAVKTSFVCGGEARRVFPAYQFADVVAYVRYTTGS